MDGKRQRPHYGNWISGKEVAKLWGVSLALGLPAAALFQSGERLLALLLGSGAVLAAAMGLYLLFCRRAYAFHGGEVMGKLHALLLRCLPWDGRGRLLDIGCGSGALCIRAAKRFPDGEILGLDTWEPGWGYSQEQCRENARLEAVPQVEFIRGSACSLPFPSESLDAVISNLVFHEVRQEQSAEKLLREALRVLKPGGSFAFQDLFEDASRYGDSGALCAALREEGVQELHYLPHTERADFIPGYLRKPLMLRDLGILYGKK